MIEQNNVDGKGRLSKLDSNIWIFIYYMVVILLPSFNFMIQDSATCEMGSWVLGLSMFSFFIKQGGSQT